ncbi:MAG: ABC transporter substrate-binding protein [Pirellulales bacterium]
MMTPHRPPTTRPHFGRQLSSGLVGCGLILAAACWTGCADSGKTGKPEPHRLTTWDEVVASARGATVNMAMWDGDPLINAYMRDYVAPELRRQFGIELRQVGGQGNSLVNRLMVEKEAARDQGDIDLAWINGETFFQLRRIEALYGPFTERLPNNQYVNWDDRFIAIDFQQPVEGFECPWGNVQQAIIYDSLRVESPPRTLAELEAWVKTHPGRFTFDQSFTGMTFLKALLSEFAGGPGSLDGPFDEAKYREASAKLWEYLRRLKPHLWRAGKTFPEGVAQLHQLFNNHEVDFTMSNNDGEVDNKAIQGVIPDSSRAYVLKSGTIRNSHYVGIPWNSSNKAAAMVVANFLLSPEAQYRKALPEVWGDGSVLDASRLPDPWKTKFLEMPGRTRAPSRSELREYALMEPAPEIMLRLQEDFRQEIVERDD